MDNIVALLIIIALVVFLCWIFGPDIITGILECIGDLFDGSD